MNDNNNGTMQKIGNNSRKILFIIVLIVPIVLISIVMYFHLFYTIPAALAVISFSNGVILLMKKKPFYFLIALMIGALFLASSIIEYESDKFSNTLTRDELKEFSRVLRPERISQGLSNIAMGFGHIVINILMIIKDGRKIREGNNVIYLLNVFIGIGFFLIGINSILHGLQIL